MKSISLIPTNKKSAGIPKRQITVKEFDDGRIITSGYSDEGNERTFKKTVQDGDYISTREIKFTVPEDKKSAQRLAKKFFTEEHLSIDEIKECTSREKSTVYGYLK